MPRLHTLTFVRSLPLKLLKLPYRIVVARFKGITRARLVLLIISSDPSNRRERIRAWRLLHKMGRDHGLSKPELLELKDLLQRHSCVLWSEKIPLTERNPEPGVTVSIEWISKPRKKTARA